MVLKNGLRIVCVSTCRHPTRKLQDGKPSTCHCTHQGAEHLHLGNVQWQVIWLLCCSSLIGCLHVETQTHLCPFLRLSHHSWSPILRFLLLTCQLHLKILMALEVHHHHLFISAVSKAWSETAVHPHLKHFALLSLPHPALLDWP